MEVYNIIYLNQFLLYYYPLYRLHWVISPVQRHWYYQSGAYGINFLFFHKINQRSNCQNIEKIDYTT